MKLDKAGLLAKDPIALKTFERVVRECARIGASHVGALEFAEDIAQELVIIILYRTIHIYDEQREIEPFLIEAAKRIGKTMRRKHGREVLIGEGSADDARGGDWIESVADPLHEDLSDRMDRERAEQRADADALLARLAIEAGIPDPTGRHAPDESAALPAPAARKARPKVRPKRRSSQPNRKPLCKSARRIREIRLQAKYTHRWMAQSLGITLSQMHAIEYGISKPGDGLVARAEAILKEIEAEAPALLGRGSGDVVRSWLKRLGLHPEDYTGFAEVIGVNRSTAFRWLRKTYRPTSERLWAVELLVQEAERKRKSVIQALPRTVQ